MWCKRFLPVCIWFMTCTPFAGRHLLTLHSSRYTLHVAVKIAPIGPIRSQKLAFATLFEFNCQVIESNKYAFIGIEKWMKWQKKSRNALVSIKRSTPHAVPWFEWTKRIASNCRLNRPTVKRRLNNKNKNSSNRLSHCLLVRRDTHCFDQWLGNTFQLCD